MTNEKPTLRTTGEAEEQRSAREWGYVLINTPERVAAIDAGRTKALERAIGAEMRFSERMATVSSTRATDLPSALTCTLSPMEGDTSMWSRITAAADLAFGARAMLELFLRGENATNTIATQSITATPGSTPIDPMRPVVMVEESGPYAGKKPTKEGVIRFVCHQGGKSVGTVDVAYRYMPNAALSRGQKSQAIDERITVMALSAKDRPIPASEDIQGLQRDMGIGFRLSSEEERQGFDAKYAPYPHCLNYWGSAHGSGLVTFATMGISEAANGFTVQYRQAAIGEFDHHSSEAQSTRSFYRRRLGNRIQVWSQDPDGKPILHLEIALREPAKHVEERLRKLDAGANPYLRSLAGMRVSIQGRDIEAHVEHADFGLLATYADQIFHFVASKDFQMAGPTRSIRVKRTKTPFINGRLVALRPDSEQWSTFTYDPIKRKRRGVVFFDCIQDGHVVAKVEVECVIGTRGEHAFARSQALSDGIRKSTYEEIAKVLFRLAARRMRQLPSAEVGAKTAKEYASAIVGQEQDRESSYHSLQVKPGGTNLIKKIHGASTAALAASLVDGLEQWPGYVLDYLAPGKPGRKIYHRNEGDRVILSQYGKDPWGRPGMQDFVVLSKTEG